MRYALDEIERMRAAVEDLLTYWSWPAPGFTSPPKAETVEAHLRTYMQNGTPVEELEQRVQAREVERRAIFAQWSEETRAEEARRVLENVEPRKRWWRP